MKLFNLSPKVLIAVGLVIALLVLGMIIPQCHAAPLDAPYVQFGGGNTIIRGPAPVLDLTFTEPANVLRHAYWQGSLTMIGTSHWQEADQPNNFAARGLFVDGFGHLDVGLGLSWMQNPRPYNGSPVNFNLQLDYRLSWLPVTITYSHMSNAGSRLPNYGRDILLLGWRFR